MNIAEFYKVKGMTYLEYCDYLQDKYGIGLNDYMSKSYNKNSNVSRTSEGLFVHHKMEDRASDLSKKAIASSYPYEWQRKENLVYCDYLEHLWLHILIYKYLSEEEGNYIKYPLNSSAIVKSFIPELNDIYSGFVFKLTWKNNIAKAIIHDKQAYLAIIKELLCFTNFVQSVNCLANAPWYVVMNRSPFHKMPRENLLYNDSLSKVFSNYSGNYYLLRVCLIRTEIDSLDLELLNTSNSQEELYRVNNVEEGGKEKWMTNLELDEYIQSDTSVVAIVKEIYFAHKNDMITPENLCKSAGAKYGVWDNENNKDIYKDIMKLGENDS